MCFLDIEKIIVTVKGKFQYWGTIFLLLGAMRIRATRSAIFAGMPLTDRDGRTARQNVSRMLSRGVRDAEMASALGLSLSTYSRRKDRPDFPTYDELRKLAAHLGVDATILLIDFGYVDVDTLNKRLQQRYRTYRRAVEIMKSLRTQPKSDTQQVDSTTEPVGSKDGAGPTGNAAADRSARDL